MRLFISAGEASGDAYGAALVDAVRAERIDVAVEALGGPKLRSAGATIVADSSTWGAISIVKSLGVGPRVLAGGLAARKALKSGTPGVFVPIDFGFLNIKLARIAKRARWKVLYFIPPGSWRKDRQGADLPAITDVIVTPFSWSAEILQRMGADARWYGHPIKSMARVPHPLTPSPDGRGGIAILPGSRAHEIEQNLPVIAKAIEGLPTCEFAVAPTVNLAELKRSWETLTSERNDTFTSDDVFGVLRRARAAIVCSGTATLQAAVCKCPMVVVYRLSKAMEIEAKLLGMRRKLKFVSLPNIFMDRAAVPELIHWTATPENVRSTLLPLLEDGPERTAQLAAFEEIDAMLGPDDCIAQTARIIVELCEPEAAEVDYLKPNQEEGMVGEREVAQAKAQEMGFNFVDLPRYRIDSEAITSLSVEICRQLAIVPVKRDGPNLYVAMVDPAQVEVLDAVRRESGCRVIPVVALRDAIIAAIDACYP